MLLRISSLRVRISARSVMGCLVPRSALLPVLPKVTVEGIATLR